MPPNDPDKKELLADQPTIQPSDTLTAEAIERDPWNAVRLPIPDSAPAALLRKADLAIGELLLPYRYPEDISEKEFPRYSAAAERGKLVRGLIDDLRGPEIMTLDAINHDSWNAVRLDLPAELSPDLISLAHAMAERCYVAAFHRFENPDWEGHSASEPNRWPMPDGTGPEDAATQALARLEELERIDPTLERMVSGGRDVFRDDHEPGNSDTLGDIDREIDEPQSDHTIGPSFRR
jgi:hypothetical protein